MLIKLRKGKLSAKKRKETNKQCNSRNSKVAEGLSVPISVLLLLTYNGVDNMDESPRFCVAFIQYLVQHSETL